jgi:hypothetical protein
MAASWRTGNGQTARLASPSCQRSPPAPTSPPTHLSATPSSSSTAPIAGGTGVIEIGDGVLTLLAEAPDGETLARVQDVLGRHLERFGQRNELTVVWTTDHTEA